MLDAFKSGGTKEASGSKTRKALHFEEEPLVEVTQEVEGETQVVANGHGGTVEISVASAENSGEEAHVVDGLNNKENQDSRTSEEKLEMNEGDLGSEVEGGPLEMVAGLGNEDGSLEYVMFEDGEDEEQERYLVEEGNPGDTEMVMVDANVLEGVPQTDDIGDLIGEKGRQKKKSGKLNAAATGGNAKKRAVFRISKEESHGEASQSLPAWSSCVDKGVKTREEGILVADGTSGESLVGCPYVEGYFVTLVPQNVGDDSMNTNRDLLSFLLVRLGNGVLVVALCHINRKIRKWVVMCLSLLLVLEFM
ncbi:hypothetical protein F2Q68_00038448 [Brassica cretica]|uniref:Uncharacterized protein n=2 Tax=Brassica TaxID=3705 RepID=A0A8S9MN15_BRACR|nr:hypothetical protein F2Q68_00038448 [Brassica cretica]